MKNVEIFLRNLLLKILLLFNGKESVNKLPEINEDTRILFIRLNKIGDALVTTPLLRLIKEKTSAKLFILASRSNRIIFTDNPDFERVFVFQKGFSGIKQIRRIVMEYRIDIVVDTHDDVSTTVSFLCAGSKAPFRLSLKKSNETVFSHTIDRPDSTKTHIVDRILKLAELMNIESAGSNPNVNFPIPATSEQFAENFFNEKIDNSKFSVGINISAGSEARYFGTENYSNIVGELMKIHVQIILLCTPADSEKAIAISSGRAAIFDGNFHQLAAIIQRLDLLISPDTSAVHLASACKTPVFGIYVHDTKDVIWSPYKSRFEWVETTRNDLKNITVGEVKTKLLPYIEKLIHEKE